MILVGKGAEFTNIGSSSPDTNATFYAKYDPSDANMVAMARTVAAAGSVSTTGTVTKATVKGGISANYSTGDVAGKFICQKCHKLVSPYQGIPGADGNGHGGRNNNLNYMGFSNEVHMEHHGNAITGVADCVACHVAVPHGWTRPRLLVYETDAAPYKVALPAVPAGVTSAFSLATGSTHLDSIDAAASATKDLGSGNAADFAASDAANGTNYSFWSSATLGTGWNADPNALPSGDAVQNNCNACSKTGATHTPASEGFTSATPSWK